MTEPSISETAFDCPHCGAFTTQHWHIVYVEAINRNPPIPFVPPEDFRERVAEITDWDREERERVIVRFEKMRAKLVFTDNEETYSYKHVLHNAFASRCYNCGK